MDYVWNVALTLFFKMEFVIETLLIVKFIVPSTSFVYSVETIII